MNANHRLKVFSTAAMATLAAGGCVRRTMTITTEPPQALVFLNDEEVGRSEVKTDFLWYGDYDVVIRMEGYETLHTHWDVKPPWYQRVPFDFFAEVFWPGTIVDARSHHFVLTEAQLPTSAELIERATELRQEALQVRQKPPS